MALLKPKWLYDNVTFRDVPTKHHKVCVHQFYMNDAYDSDIYTAEPIFEWKKTEKCKFVMENSLVPPSLHRMTDPRYYGYTYAIVAYFDEKAYTYYKLKYE